MPVKTIIEEGGEWLLGFARNRLADLRARRQSLGVDIQQAVLEMDSGEQVLVRSHLDYDLIRVTASAKYPKVFLSSLSVLGPHNLMSFQSGESYYVTDVTAANAESSADRNVVAVGVDAPIHNRLTLRTEVVKTTALRETKRYREVIRIARQLFEARMFRALRVWLELLLWANPVMFLQITTGEVRKYDIRLLHIRDFDGVLHCVWAETGVDGSVLHSSILGINPLEDLLRGNDTVIIEEEEHPYCRPVALVDLSTFGWPDTRVISGTLGDVATGLIVFVNEQTRDIFEIHPAGCGYDGSYQVFDFAYSNHTYRVFLDTPQSIAVEEIEERVPQKTETLFAFSSRQAQLRTPLQGTITHTTEHMHYELAYTYGARHILRRISTSFAHQETYHSDCGLDPGDFSIPSVDTVLGREAFRTATAYKETMVANWTEGSLYYKGALVHTGPLQQFFGFGSEGVERAQPVSNIQTGISVCAAAFECPDSPSSGPDIHMETNRVTEYEHVESDLAIDGRQPYQFEDVDYLSEVPPMAANMCAFLMPRPDGEEEGICYTVVTPNFLARRHEYLRLRLGGGTSDEIEAAKNALRAEYTVVFNNFASLDLMDLGVASCCVVVLQ